MQKKIIVPTDFSANSKAGIKFAVQLASQTNTTLVFYHSIELIQPMRWTDGQFKTYVKNQLARTTAELTEFVDKCYAQMGVPKGKVEYVAERGADPKKSVVKYAVAVKAAAICMGTRGAGDLKKVIGTNASGILSTSPVPVFVIPNSYRKAPISNILYASDLADVKAELKRVAEFAVPLKSNVRVYHYTNKIEESQTRKKLLTIQQQHSKAGVAFVFDKFGDQTFPEHFQEDMKRSKASFGVLFTNQKRKWFDKLFQGSNAEEASFNTKVPILVFPKE